MIQPSEDVAKAVRRLKGDPRWEAFHQYLLDCFSNSKEALVSTNEGDFRNLQGQSRTLKMIVEIIENCNDN